MFIIGIIYFFQVSYRKSRAHSSTTRETNYELKYTSASASVSKYHRGQAFKRVFCITARRAESCLYCNANRCRQRERRVYSKVRAISRIFFLAISFRRAIATSALYTYTHTHTRKRVLISPEQDLLLQLHRSFSSF